MIRRAFLSFIAICFPWLTLLMYDNPGGAIVALVLQCTFFGWIPAAMWALRVMKDAEAAEAKKRS